MPRATKSRYRVLRGLNWPSGDGERRVEAGVLLDVAELAGVDVDQEVADGVLEPVGSDAPVTDNALSVDADKED